MITIDAPVDGVRVLTLCRPEKKNALSISLRDECSAAVESLAADPDVRCMVITGAGSVFSAGFDLGEFADTSSSHQQRLWESSDRFHHAIYRFPVPTIAAVNGAALAGGFDLACLCDLRVVSSDAVFGHPEQQWSTVIYRLLHDLIGGSRARELAFTGRRIDASIAATFGLANQVVPPDQLMPAALALGAQIASAPREVLERTKAKALAVGSIAASLTTLDW